MITNRKFAGFVKSTASGSEVPSFRMKEIPDGGMCLSSFLVISEQDNPKEVLMGRLNPKAPWDHIGALDEGRIQAHSKGWMLPSSHLIIHESPQEAAVRILREQIGIASSIVALSDPKVVSEVSTPRRFPNLPHHWDIEFIFRGTLARSRVPKSDAWVDLKFVDLGRTSRSEMARSHEDILESMGFEFSVS
jgi:ADP-ribose pyrophosphatase YjhB (NUDIX family)